jgi:hypothetical protein
VRISSTCQSCGAPIPPSIPGDAFCTRCRYGGFSKPEECARPSEWEVALAQTAAPEPPEADPELAGAVEAARWFARTLLELICEGGDRDAALARAGGLAVALGLYRNAGEMGKRLQLSQSQAYEMTAQMRQRLATGIKRPS